MTTPPRKRAPAKKSTTGQKAVAAKKVAKAPAKKSPTTAKRAPAKKVAPPVEESAQQAAPTANVGMVSEDGNWRWDGATWQPNITAPPQPAVSSKADARADSAARKARRSWFLRHKILTGLAALIALIVIISVASSGGGSKKGTSVPAVADSPAASGTPGSQSPATSSAAPAAATTLLAVTGSGSKQTQKFTAAGDWDLAYTYDCAAFGQSGNFQVDVFGSDGGISLSNPGVNELGMKGSDVTHEHNGGTYYLSVNSECAWTVKVTG